MMKFLSRFTNSIIGNATHTVTFAAVILAVSALVADILGLLRDRLLAAQFGAGRELDVYNAAFRLPDFLFSVLFGSISAAFLPVFSELRAKDPKEAWRLTSNLLSLTVLVIGVLALIMFVGMQFFVPLMTPGFSVQDQDVTVQLSRWLLISPIFFGISSFFSGILHYFKKFLLFSFAPVLYNFGIIVGVLWLSPKFGVWGAVAGVLIGAFMHMAIQLPGVLSEGFVPKLIFAPFHPQCKEVITLLIPRVPNLIIANINAIIMTMIATSLAAGSLAIFTFADNLRTVPVGIIGVSFATAAFPNLASAWGARDKHTFFEVFLASIREVLFLVLPLSFLAIVLRAHIIRVILGSGKFDWEATQLTAASLALFAFGIAAQSLIPVFVRAFFAAKDTVAPLLINIVSVAINVGIALYAVASLQSEDSFLAHSSRSLLHLEGFSHIGVLALPLSFSISTSLQALMLLFLFGVRHGSFITKKDAYSFIKIFTASSIAAVAAFISLRVLAAFFDLNYFYGVFAQGVLAGIIGLLAYIGAALVFNITELRIFITSFKKQFMPRTIPISEENGGSSMHIK